MNLFGKTYEPWEIGEGGMPKKDIKKEKGKVREDEVKCQESNGIVIAGFVLGTLSIFFSSIGMIPILAVIFSGVGLFELKERNQKKGKTLAIIGLILGVIYTLVYLQTYGYIKL